MNSRAQSEWGRALWNMATGVPQLQLLPQCGWKVDILDSGRRAIIDTEHFLIVLRTSKNDTFRSNLDEVDHSDFPAALKRMTFVPVSDEDTVTAEIFRRAIPEMRLPPSPPKTVAMSAESLWTMRAVWDRICNLTDEQRHHATGFRIVEGEIPGRTTFVVCGGVVWHLRSQNPRAFIRDSQVHGGWKSLPPDAAIDGTMTISGRSQEKL